MVWSPPSVMTRGWFLPSAEMGTRGFPVNESFPRGENVGRWRSSLWPSSICLMANLLSYGVTGMSPQSTSLSPERKGLTARGTL